MRATSLPRRCCTAISARKAIWVARGSTTIILAPFSRPLKIHLAAMGWFSVVLEPMMKMHLASANSGRELVMAPEPKAAARPTTVELCQRRAQ